MVGESGIRSFRDLKVWQRSMDVAEQAYRLTRTFPNDERFGLSSQIRRAAASIPANIAEGHGRGTRASYASFLRIARGSLRELETHLILAARVEITPTGTTDKILADIDELGRMLHGLLSRLSSSLPDA
jgi:four helix bundle protein